jgi:hypothetical protein
MTDTLNTSPTKHCTDRDQPLAGLLKVDGITWRLIGGGKQRIP